MHVSTSAPAVLYAGKIIVCTCRLSTLSRQIYDQPMYTNTEDDLNANSANEECTYMKSHDAEPSVQMVGQVLSPGFNNFSQSSRFHCS